MYVASFQSGSKLGTLIYCSCLQMNLMGGGMGFGSRMSLNSNHDDENDDDNFDDTISILHGQTPTTKKEKLFGEIRNS